MLKNKLFLLVFVTLSCLHNYAQRDKTCNNTKKHKIDVNTINKCVNVKKTSKQDNGFASLKENKPLKLSRTRKFVRRRKKKVTDANVIQGSSRLENIRKETALVSALKLSQGTVDELPFDYVDKKPTFSKCVGVASSEETKCFKERISNHIKKNFRYPEKSFEKGVQGKVLVQFVIDEFGAITNIKTKGPIQGEELENEAKRIIKRLPEFSPAEFAGNAVKVRYGVPINFKIQGRKATNTVQKNKENVILDNVVSFSDVDVIPLFKGCENTSKSENKKCFDDEMVKYLKRNFYYPEEAIQKEVEGKMYVFFVIDKDGDVVNIKVRKSDKEELVNASKKIVSKLPGFIPGKLGNKAVNVKYVLPINFKLQ